ncbi:MAG TPA: universal stress protein [Terriglobia bacterium]|nr:universal stress protein [Terriglobia bacterium]
MLKIAKILCPVDFSEFSKAAFEYAVSFASRYKAQLWVQHVIEPVTALFTYETLPGWRELYAEFRAGAEEALDELTAVGAAEHVQPETCLQVGNPADLILKLARKEAVDLIVMGSHGRRGLDRLLTGSVTERVLRKAQCPVLAVQKPIHDLLRRETGQGFAIRKILLPSDFSDHARHALTYALSMAKEYHAQLTLLHVLEEIPRDKELPSETARLVHELEAVLPAGARNGCDIATVVRLGRPYWEIIELSTESQTDLIVMGGRGRGALDLAVFGSTTYRVLQLSPCPVLSVHSAAL